ncbi:MAG: hypothetical protein GY861_25135 [bacterium]|nr:hypothetical protein [bacterium]
MIWGGILVLASTISMFIWLSKDMDRAIEVGLFNLHKDKKSQFYDNMMVLSLFGIIAGLSIVAILQWKGWG